MTNTQLLNERISDLGIKKSKIASKMGISLNSLWQKATNKRDFKASEIKTLCEVLKIESSEDIERIFFAD